MVARPQQENPVSHVGKIITALHKIAVGSSLR
jgi:hypothetical protein